MNSRIFPDVNVWLALIADGHVHALRARNWYLSIGHEPIVFCRVVQLAVLRLLTNDKVMGKQACTMRQAWELWVQIEADDRIALIEEPLDFEVIFRKFSSIDSRSPNLWADIYLAGFSFAANLSLITFDRALAKRAPGSLLLTA